MQTIICRHIKTNGRRCKSPSLGLSAFCYFHSRLHRRHRNLVETAPPLHETHLNPANSATGLPQTPLESAAIELDLPPLEDAESIQVFISLLITALARNRIDSKRAAILLYGLQLVSSNARSIIIEPTATSIVRTLSRTKSGLNLAESIGPEPPKKRISRSRQAPSDAAEVTLSPFPEETCNLIH
jgi:hypothetical protein